jgi:hypothetical protein
MGETGVGMGHGSASNGEKTEKEHSGKDNNKQRQGYTPNGSSD